MPRPSVEVKADIDDKNRKRVALDRIIADRREALTKLNSEVAALEVEYQAAVAIEQQAAIDAQNQPKH